MDLKTLEEWLFTLNTEIKKILGNIKYNRNHHFPFITYDKNNPNDCMLYDEFCSVFTHLDYINSVLTYLQKPIVEEGILKFTKSGTYELNKRELCVGDVIEIFMFDKNTKTYQWRLAILKEHSNFDKERARIRS